MVTVQQMLSFACKRIAVQEAIAGGALGARDIRRDGPPLFRIDRRLSERFRSACVGDYGGYSQLQQYPPRHSDQRGQDVTLPLNQLR
jgi:hypothetical protein